MAKKWFVPLLLALPFVPLLFWGFNLADDAYVSLRTAQHAATWQALLAGFGSGHDALSTPLFSIGTGFLSRLGLDPALAAALLGTLGWGVAAALMWWLGRKMGVMWGTFAAAALYGLNPWILTTLGEANGWIIALFWLLANFLVRKRYLLTVVGALFLISLFFIPSQGIVWPVELAAPFAWSVLLFAAGAGAERLAGIVTDKELVGLDRVYTTVLFVGLFGFLVFFFQAFQMQQAMAERPWALWSAEEEVAAWLRENSDTQATLLAGSRLAYLADREAVAQSPEQLQALLPENAPDYVVADATIPWQTAREMIWYRLYYEPLATFGAGNAGEASKELWALREPQAWLGPVTLLNARVPDRLSILGLQMEPQPAVSGQPVNLALHFQRPRATLIEAAPFQVILRLTSPLDGSTAAEWTVELPRTVAAEEWQPRQVIAEPLQINPPPDLESGAYLLNLSLTGVGEQELWPISFNNDVNRLDRIPLGYVVVPWRGDMENAEPIRADFAGDIHLIGGEVEQADAGDTMAVTLYWQSAEAIDEEYVVFVHLLDEAGQLVANHDGPPAGGRFPTASWRPGMTVPDVHMLTLPPDLPPGTYELRAGLYDPQTGERLALTFQDGQAVEGDSVSLGSLAIE